MLKLEVEMENKRVGVIYKITCLVNHKVYIGRTIQKNPNRRFSGHIECSKKEKPIMLICKAIKKYGKENFKFDIIREVFLVNELNKMEAYYIHKYDSCNKTKGYNVLKIDLDGKIYMSETTKEKLSIVHSNHKNKLIHSNNGKNSRGKSIKNSTSKYCGVYFSNNKWLSAIRKNKKRYYLGTFNIESEAAHAYDITALEYYGKDCTLNFPELRQQYLNGEMKINKCNRKKSNSKIIGVSFNTTSKRWAVAIKGFKPKTFKTKEEAEECALEFRKLKEINQVPVYEKYKKKTNTIIGVTYCNTRKKWRASLKGFTHKRFNTKEEAENQVSLWREEQRLAKLS